MADLETHDVGIVGHQLCNQILLAVAPGQHPWLAVAELLRLQQSSISIHIKNVPSIIATLLLPSYTIGAPPKVCTVGHLEQAGKDVTRSRLGKTFTEHTWE